jgi:hypothetical protein
MSEHKFLITLIVLISKQILSTKSQTIWAIKSFINYLGQLKIRLIRSILRPEVARG